MPTLVFMRSVVADNCLLARMQISHVPFPCSAPPPTLSPEAHTITAGLYVAMGLTLLEILPLPQLLPSSAIRADQTETEGDVNPVKGFGVAYVFGASTALVASPCATPVGVNERASCRPVS